VPASVKLQEEYGDDRQVIFVEVQGASEKKMEGFALRRKWFGGNAMWTTERPCDTGLKGIPQYVLLGADGRVLEKGHHTASATTELVDDEIKTARKGPAGTPKALAGAWKTFRKGEVAKAVQAARKAGSKEELAEAAARTVERFLAATTARLDRVEWCLDNGYIVEGKARLDALRSAVKGLDELATRAAALDSRLSDPEMKREVEASKSLARILDRVYEDGFGKKDKNKKSLEKIAKQFPGTAAATRASRLLAL